MFRLRQDGSRVSLLEIFDPLEKASDEGYGTKSHDDQRHIDRIPQPASDTEKTIDVVQSINSKLTDARNVQFLIAEVHSKNLYCNPTTGGIADGSVDGFKRPGVLQIFGLHSGTHLTSEWETIPRTQKTTS